VILLPLLLVLVLVALAATIGPLVLGGTMRERRGVAGLPIVALVVGGGAVLLLVVAPLVLLGTRGTGGDGDDGGDGGANVEPERVTAPTADAEPAHVVSAPPAFANDLLGPEVRIDLEPGIVGGLRAEHVLRVKVSGFHPFAPAKAGQCASGVCGNAIDVQLDEQGEASFQYLVVDDFAPDARSGRCRLDAPPCTIVIEDLDGEVRAELTTVFVDELPPLAQMRVEPARGLVDGSVLDVSLEGATPRARAQLLVCGAPSGGDRTPACDQPAATANVTIAGDGTASAELDLGPTRPSCADGGGCVVVLRSDDAVVRAPMRTLSFARPPGVDYDSRRVLAGLAVAVLLAALATFLIRRTDWSAVGEEAAPEIDDAEYADLDAIIAALPPEEDDESLLV
jgi:hypothetical protein